MDPELTDFRKLCNFADPAGTEKKFRKILPIAESGGQRGLLAELLTQIARAQGLQDNFSEAHATLDRVEAMLDKTIIGERARVCYYLERGRVFNSSGQPLQALPFFRRANGAAIRNRQLRLRIDAMHMVAIAEPKPADQLRWNLRAIDLVTRNPTEQGWLYALYNNTGETYLLLKDYPKALEMFQKLADLDRKEGKEPDIFAMKDIGKCLRLCNRLDESEKLLSSLTTENNPWVEMELGETLLAQRKPAEANPHLQKAYEALSQDKSTDPKLLEHLKKLVANDHP